MGCVERYRVRYRSRARRHPCPSDASDLYFWSAPRPESMNLSQMRKEAVPELLEREPTEPTRRAYRGVIAVIKAAAELRSTIFHLQSRTAPTGTTHTSIAPPRRRRPAISGRHFAISTNWPDLYGSIPTARQRSSGSVLGVTRSSASSTMRSPTTRRSFPSIARTTEATKTEQMSTSKSMN